MACDKRKFTFAIKVATTAGLRIRTKIRANMPVAKILFIHSYCVAVNIRFLFHFLLSLEPSFGTENCFVRRSPGALWRERAVRRKVLNRSKFPENMQRTCVQCRGVITGHFLKKKEVCWKLMCIAP